MAEEMHTANTVSAEMTPVPPTVEPISEPRNLPAIPIPITAARTIARPGLRVRRSAVAAGPTSSAVLRIAPIVNAASATARASASR